MAKNVNADDPISKVSQSVPWARPGDYREEDSNFIIGNLEGLQALRAAIDNALDKGEAFIEEPAIEFSHIKVSDQATPDFDDAESGSKLAMVGCLLILSLFVVVFLIGCVEVVRYLFNSIR